MRLHEVLEGHLEFDYVSVHETSVDYDSKLFWLQNYYIGQKKFCVAKINWLRTIKDQSRTNAIELWNMYLPKSIIQGYAKLQYQEATRSERLWNNYLRKSIFRGCRIWTAYSTCEEYGLNYILNITSIILSLLNNRRYIIFNFNNKISIILCKFFS